MAENNNIKATSFRVSEEDILKFKEFADKEGYNQAEAFKSIMQSFEMAQAKGIIKDRAKEIETFQDTINKLMGYYLNSLEVNQNSEERIREELQKELITKDNTISALYEQVQDLKADNETLKGNNKEIDSKLGECKVALVDKSKECIRLEEQVNKLNSNNDLLQEQLQEYKQYKEQYKALEEQLEQLKADNSTKDNTINSLENSIKQFKDKIKNDIEMLDFYKNNNLELKDNIKALEETHKQQIQEVKGEATKVLDERIKASKQEIINKEIELNNKNDIELQKKDLEIQKLQNEIEQLKAKSNRTVNKTNNLKK